jgi:hypothetical protein
VKADIWSFVFLIETNILRKLNELRCPHFVTAVFSRDYRCWATGYITFSLVIYERLLNLVEFMQGC